MPGAQTQLTSRLDISRRQFFQWHLVEKRQISEVKGQMDELTRALNFAGYDYNFIAEEKSWRSRSRHWNKLGKTAWKVEPHEKGRDLPIPAELANVPVWVEWDVDVGDWRNSRSSENDGSQTAVAQPDKHQRPYQNTLHWNGQAQDLARTEVLNDFESSHATSVSSPTLPRSPHLFNLAGTSSTAHTRDTETTAWPQQNLDPFTSTHPPLSLPEQTGNTHHQQQHIDGSNLWYQNPPTATLAPAGSVPLPNAIHRNDHDLASFMSPQTQSTSASASNFPVYTRQGQSGYQNGGYLPQPSSLGFQDQHEAADVSATQILRSQGSSVAPWTSSPWKNSQYDSASS